MTVAARTPIYIRQSNELTIREKQVVDAVCLGYSNQQIADLLVCGYETVKSHLVAIYDKTGLSTKFELATKYHGSFVAKEREVLLKKELEMERTRLRCALDSIDMRLAILDTLPGNSPIPEFIACRLTKTQKIISDLITDGHTNENIARMLKITPGGVRAHVVNILGRLGMHKRTDLIVAMIKDRHAREVIDLKEHMHDLTQRTVS